MQRSTTLKLVERHCLYSLDHYEAGTPYDRDIFDPGIAGHAVLQVIGQSPGSPMTHRQIADAVVAEITTVGRAFDGVPEPPMPVDAAIRGRDMALVWLSRNTLSETASYEKGYAVDADWRPVPYGAGAWYGAALDQVDVLEEMIEEGSDEVLRVLVVNDWKTAWPIDATELETTQLKGQGLVALANYSGEPIHVLRRQVTNIRTFATYTHDLVLDEQGQETLALWRQDVALQVAATEHRGADGGRPANPGAKCCGCPYVLACDAARTVDVLDIPTRYAVACATAGALEVLARKACAEGSVKVPGGVVGFIREERNKALPDIHTTLAHAWFGVPCATQADWDADNERMLGMLAALGLGSGNAEKIGTRLHPGKGKGKADGWRENREAFVATCVQKVTSKRFGVWPDARPEVEDNSAPPPGSGEDGESW